MPHNASNVTIPASWLGLNLVIRVWTAPDEPAPKWNGSATEERTPNRSVPYASARSLLAASTSWDRLEYCLLREFVVPAQAVTAGVNEISFAASSEARGTISVGTLPTEYGICGRTAALRERHLLDGAGWRFKLVPDDDAARALRESGFAGVDSTIEVPSNWEMRGFSKPTYGQWRDESPTVGMYARTFHLEPPTGSRAHLVFEGACGNAEVWLNGETLGDHESGFTAFERDVTDSLHTGDNELVVRVSKYSRSAFFENAGQNGYWYLGGLFRSVYAYLTPSNYISGFRTDTGFSADLRSAEVTVTAEISCDGPRAGDATVRAVLVGPDGSPHEASAGPIELVCGADGWTGVSLVQMTIPVPDVAHWSAETPNLYRLRLDLCRGVDTIDSVEDRIGLRRIAIEGQIFSVNGVPVKLRGMCRHDFSPTDGYATKPELWRRDLELMREAGVNAVRFSHYSPAEGFVRLCDEKGFYVVHESAGMWVEENDDRWYPDYHERARETLERDVNRACVLMWGIGNEHADTVNFRRTALWCRRNDSRPVVYAGSATSLDGDLVTPHYTGKRLVESLEVEPKRPVLCTEDCTQSRGWWPKGIESFTDAFKDYWDDVVLPDDRIGGMFIWEWDDRTVVWNGSILLSNTVGYGLDSYESQVGPWRRTDLPWFGLLKQVYSPVRVDVAEGDAGLILRNQYDFTDLGDVAVSWTLFEVDADCRPLNALATGSSTVPMPPRSKIHIALDVPESRPDWLAIDVELRPATGNPTRKRLFVGPSSPAPLAVRRVLASATSSIEDDRAVLRLESEAGSATFDAATAMLRGLRGARSVALDGLVPNLWITPPGAAQGGFPDRSTSLDSGNILSPRIAAGGDRRFVVSSLTLDRAANPLTLTTTYEATEAGLLIRYELRYLGRVARVAAEGVRFTLPGSYTHWRWRGRGPWATYPGLVLGAEPGVYEAPIVAKRHVGESIPLAEEPLIGCWERDGGSKSDVDRFWVCGPEGELEIRLGRPAFVELERVGDRIEVRVNHRLARIGDEPVPLGDLGGEMLIAWPTLRGGELLAE